MGPTKPANSGLGPVATLWKVDEPASFLNVPANQTVNFKSPSSPQSNSAEGPIDLQLWLLTMNAKSLLLGGAAMVNSHFLFVVVQFQRSAHLVSE
jgi:hypothetical protein